MEAVGLRMTGVAVDLVFLEENTLAVKLDKDGLFFATGGLKQHMRMKQDVVL